MVQWTIPNTEIFMHRAEDSRYARRIVIAFTSL